MDDFTVLLARDFGFRSQGKSAPMIAGDSLIGGRISQNRSSSRGCDDAFGIGNHPRAPQSASCTPSFDSVFGEFKDSAQNPSTSPVFNVKNSSSTECDDVFFSVESNHASSLLYYDFLDNLGRTVPEQKGSVSGSSEEQSGIEELIPGFGGCSPPEQRESQDTKQQPAVPSAEPTSNVQEDPFIGLETTTASFDPLSGSFADPLEYITRLMNSATTKVHTSPVGRGIFDDNTIDELTKSVPMFTSEVNENPKDKSLLKTEKEPPQGSSRKTFDNTIPKVQSTKPSVSVKPFSRHAKTSDANACTYKRTAREDQSSDSYGHLATADDAWITVAEIPLCTQLLSVPPPSRLPPSVAIKQTRYGKTEQFSPVGLNGKRMDNESCSQFTKNYLHRKDSVEKLGVSSIDELENFAMGKPQRYAEVHVKVHTGVDEIEMNSAVAASTAAMNEVMDRASEEFNHATDIREREQDAKSASSRGCAQKERDEKPMPDAQAPEYWDKQEKSDQERDLRGREENERQWGRENDRERQCLQENDREDQCTSVRWSEEANERTAADARGRNDRAAVDRATAEAQERAARENQHKAENDLDLFFSMGAQPNSIPKQRATTWESSFDARFQNKGLYDGAWTSPGSSSTSRKEPSSTTPIDDLTSIFGGFQEVEGESEERRRARLERELRTNKRVSDALATKNERDMQELRDQAERHGFVETLDIKIKQWAAGKEGNLRALLSSLQDVLWHECDWQPVSLTDLITPASVKKVYMRATLYIHPDKVQQKGANLQQKYTAEKVFHILKNPIKNVKKIIEGVKEFQDLHGGEVVKEVDIDRTLFSCSTSLRRRITGFMSRANDLEQNCNLTTSDQGSTDTGTEHGYDTTRVRRHGKF